MTFSDAKLGEVINGLKCIRERGTSNWSTWTLDNTQEWTEQQRAQWNQRKQEKAQRKAQDVAAIKSRSLSATERDAGYRAILDQLELHPTDRADLLSRGFTEEEIIASGFKSVQRYQRLKTPVNPLLPGVTKGGTQLITADDGYLCPVRNVSGQIVGCQVRWRNPADGNRYAWLSGNGNVLHFFPDGSEGELPLAIHFPIKEKAKEVSLIEGTGAKPFLAANRLSSVVIGAAGGLWLASRQTLKNALEVVTEGNKVIIIVYPDAGDVINPQVMNRWRNTIEYLQQLGYEIAVKWWNQITKDSPDIDELSDLSQIKTISVKEFFDLPKSTEVRQAIRTGKAWELWRKAKQFTGDINITSRYISGVIETPKSGNCTCINSGLGSGKTTLLYQLLKENPAQGVIFFGARNNLLRQFCGETGTYHLQDDLKGDKYGELLLADPQSKVACCIDSIIHFHATYFDEKILILDEFEATYKQLLMANTAVSQWRQRAGKLLIEAFSRCERIVILDGGLKDSTVASLEEIFANRGIAKKIVKIKNLDNSLTSNKVRFYIGAETNGELNGNNTSVFKKYILENARNAPFVVVADSQIFLEALEEKLIQLGLKGLRIDSTTTNREEVSIFLKNADAPKEWILLNNPDYLLLSPSLENGGNIDIPGYFKNIFGYFCGVLLVDEQLQILRRVRDSEALIHVYCKPVGMNSNGSVSTSPFPHEIEATLKEFMDDCAQATFEGLDLKESLNKLVQNLTTTAAKSEFFKHECKLRAIANHERFNLRECLYETLENKGYDVEPFSEIKTDDPIKEFEEEVKDKNSKNIAESEDVTTEKAEEINRNPRASQEDKWKATRRKYLDRLPGIEKVMVEVTVTKTEKIVEADGNTKTVQTEEEVKVPLFDANFVRMVHYDDRTMISRLETLHFLKHPEQAKILQQNRWYKMLEPTIDENPRPFNLSTGYRSLLLKVNALNEIGITKFFEPGKTWTSQDADVIKAWQKAKNPKIVRAIAVKPGKDTPVAFLGRLLKSLGFSTESQRGSDGNRERVYWVKESPFDNQTALAMLECIATRINTQIAQTETKDFSVFVRSTKPTVATAPIVKPVEEINPYQELTDMLAAAGSLAGVRALVSEYTWECCDAAVSFAPIELRGQLNQWLRQIKLEPVAVEPVPVVESAAPLVEAPVEEAIPEGIAALFAKVEAESEVKPLVPIGSEVWILKEGRWKGFSGKVDKILSSIAVRCQITVAGFRSWVELAAGEFTMDWYEFKRSIG